MFTENKTVCLLGDAPNLEEIRRFKESESILIALNRAYLRHKSNIHFFADRRYVLQHYSSFDYSMKAIFPKYFDYPFKEVQTYNPVWTIDQEFVGRLKAGHSVLIPALHYAMLRKPKKIILWGVQLQDHRHWYEDKSQPLTKKQEVFPSKDRVFDEVAGLLKAFPAIKVLSGSKDSFLVSRGLIDVY
jgi:hypothetical protein